MQKLRPQAPTKRSLYRRCPCILAALTSFSATGAASPEGQPEVGSAAEAPRWLSLRATELSLELETEYQRRRVGSERPGTPSQRNRDFRLAESVQLRLDGDVIDPLFINWTADLKLGVGQERYYERVGHFDQTDSDSGIVQEFDVSLNILPAKPFSVTAYARHVRDRVPRRFLPSLLEENTESGVTAFWNQDHWTSELGLSWSDLDRSGNQNELEDESVRTRRLYWDNRWQFTDTHHLGVVFDHQREESQFQGSRNDWDTNRDELRLEHELAFGPGAIHRLDTFVRLNNEKGDLPRDESELIPRLTLQHSDALRTIYRYSFYRLDQGGIEMRRNKFDWQAIYQPDRNLRISGDLFGLREETEDDVDTCQIGGSLDAAYRQPTPHGELLVNAAFYLDNERSTGDPDGGVVRDETHVLDPTRPTYLIEPDIRRDTIVARNLGRTRIYLPGHDYIFVAVGRRTVVYRLLGGRIAVDEAVAFDYQYRVPTNGTITSTRVDFRVEHPFAFGLTPYYAFDIRRQDANGSRGVSAFEDNTERHRFGVRYDRARWSLLAEVDLFDDDVEPYDSYQISGKTNLFREANRSMDATATASWFNFTGDWDRRHVGLIDLALTNRLQLNEYLSSSLSTDYRLEDDSVDGQTNAVDVEVGLQYRRGYFELDLTLEYDLLTVGDHDEGFGIWLTIRRDLSHLLASGTRQ